MSEPGKALRGMHIVLVCASIFLCAVMAINGVTNYQDTHNRVTLLVAMGGFGVGAVLVVYLRNFLKKKLTLDKN